MTRLESRLAVTDHYERRIPVMLLQPFPAYPAWLSDGSGFESHQDCTRVVSSASQTIHYPMTINLELRTYT